MSAAAARLNHQVSLPFSAESAGVARQVVSEWAREIAGPELIENCRLVVSELVGNAVRHARPLSGGTMDLAWGLRTRNEVTIEVSDGGAADRPRRREAHAEDLDGRGLAIVDALSTRWWIETEPSRTTVHAVLPVQRRDAR